MGKTVITGVRCDALTFPPSAGGHMRSYHLYRNMPPNIETLFIDLDVSGSEKKLADNFTQHTIAKTRLSLILEKWLGFFSGYCVSPIIAAHSSGLTPAYVRTLERCAKASAILIAEHPYQFFSIEKYNDKLLVYNAHNVEYNLQCSLFPDGILGRLAKAHTRWIEKTACRNAHVILACSEDDKRALCSIYEVTGEKVYVCPNGVDVADIRPCSLEEKKDAKIRSGLDDNRIILFIGGAHLPNFEAVHYIVNKLAPLAPHRRFLIAGTAARKFVEDMPVDRCRGLFDKRKALGIEKRPRGYGWYSLERWPEGLHVRWTKEMFGISVNTAMAGFYFRAHHPGTVTGQVYVNGAMAGAFTARNRWETHEFHFDAVEHPVIEVKLQRTMRPFGDERSLGVAIADIGYIYGNKRYALDLKGIDNSVFDYKGNIVFMGDLDEEGKKEVFKMSDIAINPMFNGSGTNLKMFEYMAAGLPVVTTRTGARGIEAVDNKDCVICSDGEFAANIEDLLENRGLYEAIKKNARRLVEERYDWKVISGKLAGILEGHLRDREGGAPR